MRPVESLRERTQSRAAAARFLRARRELNRICTRFMKLRRLLAAAAAAAVLARSPATSAQSAIAHGRRLGLGIAVGYPSVGLGGNGFFRPDASLQIDGTWGWRAGAAGLFVRGDVLFWFNRLAAARTGELVWYAGPGIFAGFAGGRYCRGYGEVYCGTGVFYLGAEAAIGLAWRFARVPIDLTVEAVPRLGLLDHVSAGPWFDVGAAFHARYYF